MAVADAMMLRKMIALDILDDDIRYAAKKGGGHFSNFLNKRSLAFAVFCCRFFWVFLVLPGRVALTTEYTATEFARACNAAVAAAIIARRERLVELADDGGDRHF